jgi:hypothetical protein
MMLWMNGIADLMKRASEQKISRSTKNPNRTASPSTLSSSEWTTQGNPKGAKPPLFQRIELADNHTETLSLLENPRDYLLVKRELKPRDIKSAIDRLSRIEKKWKNRTVGDTATLDEL